jgi:hypothetical protein
MVVSLYLRVPVLILFAWPTTGFLSLPPTGFLSLPPTTRASLSVLCADASAGAANDGGSTSLDALSRRSLLLRSLTVPLLTAVKNADLLSCASV